MTKEKALEELAIVIANRYKRNVADYVAEYNAMQEFNIGDRFLFNNYGRGEEEIEITGFSDINPGGVKYHCVVGDYSSWSYAIEIKDRIIKKINE